MVLYLMIIKYFTFMLGLVWSYSFIRTQSIFSSKTALLFKIFVSKVSWFTFALACYFGLKNFSLKAALIGILISVILVHFIFAFLKNYFVNKLGVDRLNNIKKYSEYFLIIFIIYFVFN